MGGAILTILLWGGFVGWLCWELASEVRERWHRLGGWGR